MSDDEAFTRAWRTIAEVNPFPATLGRICPHPCENECSRAGKDGAVAIHALERFLGDWGLQRRLGLPLVDEGPHPESIGVIGAGPAGLSFAYQMARRGYRVTVYDRHDKAGGMLQHGIPEYRLPEGVLDAEIRRLFDLGVDHRACTVVGRDVPMSELRERHASLFLGIGAGRGIRLGIRGEDGPGVWTGLEYLEARNRGAPVALGAEVVVVGGGNTAMDCARSARRAGARVTVLYRRTAADMPAIDSEVEAALAEGVRIECLAAPTAVERSGGTVSGVVALRLRASDTDASGRRRCAPLEGAELRLRADSVISAVARMPDWADLAEVGRDGDPCAANGFGGAAAIPMGGDVLGTTIAAAAIAQGRRAAEALHARLRGRAIGADEPAPARATARVRPECYAAKPRVAPPLLPVEARLRDPDAEVTLTVDEQQFLAESARCFSCGLCLGCEACFTYCNAGGFTRLEQPAPGAYFALCLDRCEACRKCVEVCPCGFLDVVRDTSTERPPQA